jgi:hypothetical protein
VRTDTPPNDVRLAINNTRSVLKRRAPIALEMELENTGPLTNGPDAESSAHYAVTLQVFYVSPYRFAKMRFLLIAQASMFTPK